MLILVIDTATPAVTAGLAEVTDDGVRAVAERRTVNARAHGEVLAPQIAECLADAGAGPAGVGAIVAGVGPGPFTGLRVGLVTAGSMADALGVPAYGVCSLDALAYGTAGRVLAATDARRREIYFAVYADGVRLAGPAVDRPAEVAADLDVGYASSRTSDAHCLAPHGPASLQ